MKDNWTGKLVGEMHLAEVTYEELAHEVGLSKGYISLILNCKKRPPGAKERLEKAFQEICQRKKEWHRAGEEERIEVSEHRS